MDWITILTTFFFYAEDRTSLLLPGVAIKASRLIFSACPTSSKTAPSKIGTL